PPADTRAATPGSQFMTSFMTDDVLTRVQQLKPLAQEAGLSMAQLSIAWVLQNKSVSSAIIGASKPEQVLDNVKATGVKLDAELMRRIDSILGPVVERDPAQTTSPNRRP
ncbi:aldo/keto reductase, partial [Corallococcus exiguus]|nr:aldo/keto reductase [Corallococcus exiguus]